jgi:hypothetical protein
MRPRQSMWFALCPPHWAVRYAIVSEGDLADGVAKLAALPQPLGEAPRTVIPLAGTGPLEWHLCLSRPGPQRRHGL